MVKGDKTCKYCRMFCTVMYCKHVTGSHKLTVNNLIIVNVISYMGTNSLWISRTFPSIVSRFPTFTTLPFASLISISFVGEYSEVSLLWSISFLGPLTRLVCASWPMCWVKNWPEWGLSHRYVSHWRVPFRQILSRVHAQVHASRQHVQIVVTKQLGI